MDRVLSGKRPEKDQRDHSLLQSVGEVWPAMCAGSGGGTETEFLCDRFFRQGVSPKRSTHVERCCAKGAERRWENKSIDLLEQASKETYLRNIGDKVNGQAHVWSVRAWVDV